VQCNETGWRLLDHGDLHEQYEDMIMRMQGKRILFAGDSLMDMVFHPLVCGAVATGWQMSAMPVESWNSSKTETSAGCMAKMFTKAHHPPIVMGFMRFYNYGIGDVGSVKYDDVFHFPIKGGNNNFDVLVMNMAHNAMFEATKKDVRQLTNNLISRAQRATNVGRVVFLGHPPQHFKTESGAYAGPEHGGCMCHDKAALEKQPIFVHNQLVQKQIRIAGGKFAFANPWDFYTDKCTTHGHMYGHAWEEDKIDCTHWLECDVASHAPFLKNVVATAGL
jgi:hypothetical protein